MAEEKIYPYAVARIRVLEKNILNKQTLNQMAEAKSPEEALRILTEAGYSNKGVEHTHDFESLLSAEMMKTYEIIKGLVPEEKFVDVFLYKNDYHNLKVLMKEELSGLDGSKYFIDSGTIPLNILKEAIVNRDFRSLPKIMASAIEEAFDLYSKTQSGQKIDITLDQGAFASMKEAAKESKNQFVMNYVTKLCDITNLKSFLRIRKMKKGFHEFLGVFIPGGDISSETFAQAFANDSPAAIFKATSYSSICEEGMHQSFTEFERLCDNYLMEYVKEAKYMALTLEPLVAFLYAKETEIKTVRIIMTSKLNHIDTETIKERLRDAYV